MTHVRTTFIALAMCVVTSVHGQSEKLKPRISMLRALEIVIESKEAQVDLTRFVVDDTIVFGDDLLRTTYVRLREKYEGTDLIDMVDSIIVISKDVSLNIASGTLYNMAFRDLTVNMEYRWETGKTIYSPVREGYVRLENCKAHDLRAGANIILLNHVEVARYLTMTSNVMIGSWLKNPSDWSGVETKSASISNSTIGSWDLAGLSALDFYENKYSGNLVLKGEIKSLRVFNNTIKGHLDVSNLNVANEIYLQNNRVEGKVIFGELLIPENSMIHWDFDPAQLAHAYDKRDSAAIGTVGKSDYYVCAATPALFKSRVLFLGLNALHKKFYDYFISRGDIESANLCYVEMKEIQTNYYRYLYQTTGGYRNYMRWRLNWIMRVYTAYGTDPALALVISSYVILVFAVVFFFFPSEWDTTSHSAIKRHFRTFITGEKGMANRLLNLAAASLLAIFNALTLSLNSFITIGFGNIPTKGIARYACILEGTMGWFLLTLFSVALISQLLY